MNPTICFSSYKSCAHIYPHQFISRSHRVNISHSLFLSLSQLYPMNNKANGTPIKTSSTVTAPRSENGGGGEGSEWGVPIASPTKTVSIDSTITTTITSTTNADIEVDMHIAPLSEWNPISDNAPVHNSTQPDDSGYDSDASTVVWTDPDHLNATLDGFNKEFAEEYNITSGNISKWISSTNEINDKICKTQCEVTKEVETDKEQMKKI